MPTNTEEIVIQLLILRKKSSKINEYWKMSEADRNRLKQITNSAHAMDQVFMGARVEIDNRLEGTVEFYHTTPTGPEKLGHVTI